MEDYPDLIEELSGKFVETLFDLQADRDFKLEFRGVTSRTELSCFSCSRRAFHSVMEIVQAIYPFLSCKRLKYTLEADDRKILEAGNMQDRMLAFTMGCRKLLGEWSQIRAINGDALISIGKIVLNNL